MFTMKLAESKSHSHGTDLASYLLHNLFNLEIFFQLPINNHVINC